MGKPTAEQLTKINTFSQKQLQEDDVYVFKPLMIDTLKTCYDSVIHENLLKTFLQDIRKGVPLLMNHNPHNLPIGRVFDGAILSTVGGESNDSISSLYGEVYIDKGRCTESNMTTDDIINGIDTGVISDVSIGFSAKDFKCSVCGEDIRDFNKCFHVPGEYYDDKECVVVVGENGKGELQELSLVYAGACDRATIQHEFSKKSDKVAGNCTKLSIASDVKSIPLNAEVYLNYSKNGISYYYNPENSNNLEQIKKGSGTDMELSKFFADFKTTFNLDNDVTELSQISEYVTNLSKDLLETKETLSAKLEEIEALNNELLSKEETLIELEKANNSLTEQAKVAETYRQDLINTAIETGIKAQGNAFQKEMFTKFLNTLSLDEIKEITKGFEAEIQTKFGGARVTEVPNAEKSKGSDVPDFEEEPVEFGKYVANKALAYSKENGVSIKEATKLMYQKYSRKDSE